MNRALAPWQSSRKIVFLALFELRDHRAPPGGKILISSTTLSRGSFRALTTASATADAGIIFFRGASGQNVFQIAVSVAPGRSAITRIPLFLTSSRRVLVKPSAPYLDAL